MRDDLNSNTIVAKRLIVLEERGDGVYWAKTNGGHAKIGSYSPLYSMSVRIYDSVNSSEMMQTLGAICARAPPDMNACHIGQLENMNLEAYGKASLWAKRANDFYLISRRNGQFPKKRRVVSFF